MELDDELIFFFSEVAALEVRSEVVDPPQPTALAAAKKAGGFGQRAPAAFTVSSDISNEAIIFFFGPSSFVRVSLFTAWRSPH